MIGEVSNLGEFLSIGLIQPNIHREVAWENAVKRKGIFHMSLTEQLAAWEQIKTGFHYLNECTPVPKIVLIPELSVSVHRLRDLERLARKVDTVVIAGLDYFVQRKKVLNRAIVIAPNHWARSRRSSTSNYVDIGKTYPAPYEKKIINENGYEFLTDPIIWVFNTEKYGTFGVSICYDLMDLERSFLYKGRINHLFVLAYNRDINSFYHLAEALSRKLFSNVVICNNAFYGGSLAISPFFKPYKRTIYRHEGSELSTIQVIEIPVKSLVQAAKGKDPNRVFKSLPPNLKVC